MDDKSSSEFVVGDIVTATWVAKNGKRRSIRGQVQGVTKTRLRVEYERVSASGRSMNWSVVTTTVPKEFSKKVGHSDVRQSQVWVKEVLGIVGGK